MQEDKAGVRLSRRRLLQGGAALLLSQVLPKYAKAIEGSLATSTTQQKRIYIAPDDHTDLFWAGSEDDYRQAFLRMLDYYLDQADATAGNPPDFQSRWNCDGSYWLWTYEQNRSQAGFERLIGRIRSGHVSAPLNALCVCLGGAPAEAVLRGMYYPGQIERRYDLRFHLAYMMENQTQPYGLASLWAGSGASYTWKGVCGCDTQLPWQSFSDREHEVYWSVGPDGGSMLMKWNSMLAGNEGMGGYAEARDPAAIVEYVDTDPDFLARYPYQVVGAFGQGWDDLMTTDQKAVVAAQNKTNASRRVIVSNEQDFFEDFAATYGESLPAVSCSFGNEWDLYCAALAEVSARVKRAVEKLRSAEALATLVALKDSGFMEGRQEARDLAWMDLGLFWEHNFGMAGYSSGDPSVSARIAWQRKLASEVEDYVNALHTDAASALGGMIQNSGVDLRFYAFNPLSWTRTDFADLPFSDTGSMHVVDLSTGQETPSQIVTVDGERRLRILAQDVPPVGYKVFEVRPGTGQSFSDAATVSGAEVENLFYRLTVADRGAITSLIGKAQGNREFVRSINGRTVNDLGPSSGSLQVENAGPVTVTLLATAPHPLNHTTRITLFRDSNRIEIRNDINQNFATTQTWAFGFELNSPEVWHEEVGAIMRARLTSQGGHYSPRNARYDWLTLNHFADMHDGSVGITLSNADCYFMKLGNSTVSSLDTATPQISALVGGRVGGDGSWGLPAQGGDTHFVQRFALQAHKAYDPVAAMRFALEHQNPLTTGVVSGGSAYPDTKFAFLTVSNPNVLLWALKPADDGIEQGLVARLWNLSSSPADCTMTLFGGPIVQAATMTHIETPIEAAPVSNGALEASFNAHQLKTWSIVTPDTGWPAPAAPTGVSASDGTSPFRVRVRWNAVPGATSYEVWRHTFGDPASAMRIAPAVSTTSYFDAFPAPEQLYYYWVKASNPGATSDFSAPDTGWKRLPLPTDAILVMPLIMKR